MSLKNVLLTDKKKYFLVSRIEEAKRAIKRPASDHERDRYPEVERKRSTTDRRFEPPPPPRFDTSISR